MNSSKVFDDVVAYLEKIIKEGSEIDYDEISKIAISPSALFQRIFIFVSRISISDYVRKRKLTLAGHDLKNNDISVLDAAVKYGFQSHSAFTRAFKEHHGITPSEAKLETASLNDYLPINFSEMRFIGGKRIMADVKKIIYKEAEERLFVGLHRKIPFEAADKLWQEFFEGGASEKLTTLPPDAMRFGDIDANDGIAFMYNLGIVNAAYIIGDFVKTDVEIPKGLFVKKIPKGLTAHIQIEGNSISDILDSAYLLIIEAVRKTGKEFDVNNLYCCEIRTKKRYSEPLSRGEKVIIDFIISVKS